MWSVISGAELEQYLDERRAMFLVDVRDKAAFSAGHIRGAVNIPAEELPDRILELPRNRLIVLYCYHGPQSMRLARWLDQMGYDAVDVYGGIESYRGRYYTVGRR